MRVLEPTDMRRTPLALPVFALPALLLACTSNAGQNGLEALPDGYIPIPSYEASTIQEFDGSFEAGDAHSEGASTDTGTDARADAATEAAADAPAAEGATDAPHDGAGPG
jgi:hypothetical protein